MATEIPGFKWSREAAVDLSAKQFFFVTVDGNMRAALPGANGAPVAAILQNDPRQFESCELMSSGISKLVSNGTIEAGDYVAAANGGKGKEAVAGEYVWGRALEGDGGMDGTIISFLWMPMGVLP